MTSQVFETVRNLPAEHEVYVPLDAEADNRGFLFDRDFDPDSRDQSFRSDLDDIANRHPEFAEHFEDFPFRSGTLGRRTRLPRPDDDVAFGAPPEFRRFLDRPFASSARFRNFDFPFSRGDPFDECFVPDPVPPKRQPEPNVGAETAPPPPRGRNKNLQPSNTVDLGQKQEPVLVNERNQRSMSAPPPDNRQQQQRFVSSIHIPVMGEMGGKQSSYQTPPPQPSSTMKPMERVIPIHVEGRDEPVLPKSSEEKIFGQRASQFTQFVGPRQDTAFGQPPRPKVPQEAKPQDSPPVVQTTKPASPQPAAANPSPKATNPIDVIQSIQKDVSQLMNEVEQFNGVTKDKQYVFLDEMLTRNLIKLDNVDTQGQENIRQTRRAAIKCIERCIAILEAKAAANSAPKDNVKQPETTDEESKGNDMVNEPQEGTQEGQMEVGESTVQTSDETVVEEQSETSKGEDAEPTAAADQVVAKQ